MKKTIITLTIICFAFGVKAQIFEKMPDTKPALGYITLSDYNAVDTLKCWFKESLFSKWSNEYHAWLRCDEKDATDIQETWQRGYMIVNKNINPGFKSQGIFRYMNVENYLYSDRKTIVKNRVLEHIEL